MTGLDDIPPVLDPARYPGNRPASDFVLGSGRIDPLPADPTECLAGRHAVVAFGSNASPAQLSVKFGTSTGTIVVTRARLHGFALGHSPHVSIPGYVPWVLVDAPGYAIDCALLWLDDRQRRVLDATEPNYHLRPVDADRYPLVVRATGAAVGCAAYRGRWGALRWPGDERPAGATTQAVVFGRLSAFSWFRDLVGDGGLQATQRRLAGNAQLRDLVRDGLLARHMVLPDRWVEP